MTWLEWVLTATTLGVSVGWTLMLTHCRYVEQAARADRKLAARVWAEQYREILRLRLELEMHSPRVGMHSPGVEQTN